MVEATSEVTQKYLKQLRRALSPLPVREREAFLIDIAAHISDSVSAGSTADDVLASLGEPDALARATFTELELSAPRAKRARVAAKLLSVATICVAVATAVYLIHLLQAFGVGSAGSGSAALLLITLVPAATASVAAFLPLRAAMWTNLSLSGGVVAIGLSGVGMAVLYLPTAALAMAAALIPLAVSRGFSLAGSPLWRWSGAVVILFPTALFALRAVTVPSPMTVWVLGLAAAASLFAVFLGLGLALGRFGLAITGAILLLAMFFLSDVVLLPAWLLGSLLMGVGMAAIAATSPRSSRNS